MMITEQLHTSATHKPGFDPSCPACVKNQTEPNAHVHPAFAKTLNSWASIGNGLYVRTASQRRKR